MRTPSQGGVGGWPPPPRDLGMGEKGGGEHTRTVQLPKDIRHPSFPLLVHSIGVCSGMRGIQAVIHQ